MKEPLEAQALASPLSGTRWDFKLGFVSLTIWQKKKFQII
jgi:hypothetical protein